MKKKSIDRKTRVVISAALAVVMVVTFVIAFPVLSLGGVDMLFWAFTAIGVMVLVQALFTGLLMGVLKNKSFYIPLCAATGVFIVLFAVFFIRNVRKDSVVISEPDSLIFQYAPYAQDTKVVSLDEKSDLLLSEDLPVMDGATALYPVYSAFAKAVYPKDVLEDIVVRENAVVSSQNNNEYLKCSKTTWAYENIVSGEADIIFAALPNDDQLKYAEENGVELVFTPIGKEAFVFFVNSRNPMNNITLEQVRSIYSGEVTRWDELGIDGLGEIKAYQRDKGSGSQSTLEKMMTGKQLMTPPQEKQIGGMMEIITVASDYKNNKNAIGYSFRFYTNEMVGNDSIKLLDINGVSPTLENIENGKYPLASYFYAVTRSDADENTLKLLEWIQGEQGQEIIRKTGYTPLD